MAYDSSKFIHHDKIKLKEATKQLIEKANKVYLKNFNGKIWYGRCIFLSWHCSRASCRFCYRSKESHKKKHPENAVRSKGSALLEALFCKKFNWRIEFLTGGYDIMPFEDLYEFIKLISKIYGKKIWLNLGELSYEQMEKVKPYIEGICASIETPVKELHNYMCPDKPIEPYEEMLKNAKSLGFKTSAAMIVGLGDKEKDISKWFDFIERNNLDRITLYALKPIRDGPIEEGPDHDLFLKWISNIRIRFPELEIIGGTNLRRSEETGMMIRAGVNAITKYPATKQFGTKKSRIIKKLIEDNDRDFISEIIKLDEDIDWEKEIDLLDIKDEYKNEMKEKIIPYLNKFKNPKDTDPIYKN
ncbi:MAG: radical SAM protein [Nanobdellota archaeon]